LANAIRGPISRIAEAAAATLAIKTGQWNMVPAPSLDAGAWRDYQDFAMRFLRARTFQSEVPWQINRERGAGTETVSRVLLGSLAQDLAAARLFGLGYFEDVDARLATILSQPPIPLAGGDRPMLRLVMVFGEHAFDAAVERWLETVKSPSSENEPLSLSLAEMRALSTPGEMQKLFGWVFEESALSRRRERLEDPQLKLRFESPVIPMVLSEAIEKLRASDSQAIRRFAATRSEEWLVPIAYATARSLTVGEVPRSITERLAAHDPASRTRTGWIKQAFRPTPSAVGDVLQILRRADQAGDLAGTANLFLSHAEGEGGNDLRVLLREFAEWQARIERVLGSQTTSALPGASSPGTETAVPANPNPVFFVHGYSDRGGAWAAWREILRRRLHLDYANLRTCGYVSVNNEITIRDLAEAFDRALSTQGGLDPDQPFDAMVHSTGMLVVRS
jgi:hypothetical protein